MGSTVINRVAENLGKLRDARARQPLLQTLMQYPYPDVIRGLAELEEPHAIPWIVHALSDDFARNASAEALRRLGGGAVPALMEFLNENSNDATQRGHAAAGLLAELAGSDAIESLRRALDDSLPTVRLGTAITLSSFSERQEAGDAIPVLLGFLADNDPHRVEEAMGALWNLRAYSESTLMRWLHAHADDRVRATASASGGGTVGENRLAVRRGRHCRSVQRRDPGTAFSRIANTDRNT